MNELIENSKEKINFDENTHIFGEMDIEYEYENGLFKDTEIA